VTFISNLADNVSTKDQRQFSRMLLKETEVITKTEDHAAGKDCLSPLFLYLLLAALGGSTKASPEWICLNITPTVQGTSASAYITVKKLVRSLV